MKPQSDHRAAAPQAGPDVPGLQSALLAWYRSAQRDLPWRRTRDPYAIWISEAMLQQTRVQTVIPYYERFLGAFPTMHALAEAPLDEVLARWSGLGYYRRARSLHLAAREVCRAWGGVLPRRVEDLATIEGIGPYTAGAVASIAYGEPVPVVDGNVVRVLARLFALDDDGATARGRRVYWERAAELVFADDAGSWNQAMMELGATVCTPRAPTCLTCPVRAHCVGHARGLVDELPRKSAHAAPKVRERVALVVRRSGKVLLVRRRAEGLFGGLWEPPMVDAADDARARLSALVGTLTGWSAIGAVSHVLSHRRLEVRVEGARLRAAPRLGRSDEYDAIALVDAAGLGSGSGEARVATSSLARKILGLGEAPRRGKARAPAPRT